MRRTRRALLLGLLAITCTLTGGCSVFVKPPVRDCPIVSLLVDATAFPPGAGAEEPMSPLPEAAMESAGITVELPDGLANHHVCRYLSAGRAARVFQNVKKLEFAPGSAESWETPAALTYHSPIADQYHVACGTDYDGPICEMIAQYEEYYVFLTVYMSAESMTYRDLERVLRAIDERMAGCLHKQLPTRPVEAGTLAAE